MLSNQTLEKLYALRLNGMAQALKEQSLNPDIQALGFDERFGLLSDAEYQLRENRRVERLLKQANFRTNACAEDIDYRTPRGLDRQLALSLLTCNWVQQSGIVLLTGPTGAGKSWVGEALARQAARHGFTVRCERVSRLLEDLEIAHADGSLHKRRADLAKAKLLMLDDWGLAPMSTRGRQDLMELIHDRASTGATLITSQLPVDKWHDYIGEPRIADAILDRIIHSAYRIELHGDSMRKQQALPPSDKGA
jgi:DNA replication protein DnaC